MLHGEWADPQGLELFPALAAAELHGGGKGDYPDPTLNCSFENIVKMGEIREFDTATAVVAQACSVSLSKRRIA